MKNIKDVTLEFEVVIVEIQTFIEPVFDAIVDEGEWDKEWNSNSGTWLDLKGGILNGDL